MPGIISLSHHYSTGYHVYPQYSAFRFQQCTVMELSHDSVPQWQKCHTTSTLAAVKLPRIELSLCFFSLTETLSSPNEGNPFLWQTAEEASLFFNSQCIPVLFFQHVWRDKGQAMCLVCFFLNMTG